MNPSSVSCCPRQFTTEYGNVSAASIGAIQRGVLQIDAQGGDRFFGEPMLNIADFMQTVDVGGKPRGVVNILAADQLMNSPRLYATFLLWMLSEIFEQMPEVGVTLPLFDVLHSHSITRLCPAGLRARFS
ncbi:MAG TPA: helicase HerA-like domain-containing protein, partial [Burkholderiaceae bacterium]